MGYLDNEQAVTDIVREALQDSLGPDWTCDDGAKAVWDALQALRGPTAADLLGRITTSGEPDSSRLIVMAQNPSDNHRWSRSMGRFTVGEVRSALTSQASGEGE